MATPLAISSDRSTSAGRRLLAGALGFLVPGLGHVFLGRALRFGVPAIAVVGFTVVLSALGLLSTFAGHTAFGFALAALYLFAIFDPFFLTKSEAPKWYNHWSGYVGWLILLLGLSWLLITSREPLLGYGTFRVPSPTMLPTIEPGEIVLVDARAFKSRAPLVGDIVAVRGPQTGIVYIKRVAFGGTGTDLINENPEMRMAIAELSAVNQSDFVGRVAYVLYSPNPSRIGQKVM